MLWLSGQSAGFWQDRWLTNRQHRTLTGPKTCFCAHHPPLSVGLRHLMPKAADRQGPYSELAYKQKAPLVCGDPK